MQITLGPDTILRLAGLVGAILFLCTAAIKFYRFIDHTEDAWRKVTAIAAETQTNGGNSLRDAVNTTNQNVTDLITAVASTQRDLDRVQDRLDRTDTRLEGMSGWQLTHGAQIEALSRQLGRRDPGARSRRTDPQPDDQGGTDAPTE